ncbi:hypothetical protein ZYGR_0AN00370 [Zygosaccharomyces rouxii]|uniref:Uncharacterized protein n=1 Tax=Zygosaccharomyces rouxii TaxID=4956 RepID=A0A1Q3AFM4_ZYGRO|nr:hypothetical protein ZYGR_0AN00370 [Zygosaccharomyces rouxii]
MSDFFRHAKEKLVGGTNVADEHLQRLSSKYLQPEQDYIQGNSKNTEALDNLVSTAAGKSTAAEQQ